MHCGSRDFSLGLRLFGFERLYLENLEIVVNKNMKGYVIIYVTIHNPILKF